MRQFAKQQNFNPIDRVSIILRVEKQYFARLREKRGCRFKTFNNVDVPED